MKRWKVTTNTIAESVVIRIYDDYFSMPVSMLFLNDPREDIYTIEDGEPVERG